MPAHDDADQIAHKAVIVGAGPAGLWASRPGKLCLLVSAFHEATLMAFSIRKKRAGDKCGALEYTSTSSSLKALFTDR